MLQRIAEAGVSLIYRNDDGVDASTLPAIPRPDQQKQGHVFSPGFCSHFVVNRPEYSYRQGVRWNRNLPARISDADAARRPYHSPGTSGFACRDRMVVRFLRRVTTALRSGSDAADIVGFPPFRIVVDTDDDRNLAIVVVCRRQLRFVMEHIVQIAFQRVSNAMRDFQGRQTLTALNGVQRLPADINLPCELRLR